MIREGLNVFKVCNMLLHIILLFLGILTTFPIQPTTITCSLNQVLNYTWCEEGESVYVPEGSSYLDSECTVYVVPYVNRLNAIRCPLSIHNMSTSDNGCYRLLYPNETVRILNIKTEEAPTIVELNTPRTFSPFNSEVIYFFCPLYGNPSLEITWSIPLNYFDRYDGVNYSIVRHISLSADRDLRISLSDLAIEKNCPERLQIDYKWGNKQDGDYYCTGRNELGSKTVLVANLNNGSQCLSSDNDEYQNFGIAIHLQSEYKVNEVDMGSNFTIVCKLLPFTSNVRVGWLKTDDVNANFDMCTNSSNATYELLRSSNKYRIREWMESQKKEQDGPKCTKAISLTIQDFDPKDEGKYHCIVQLCSAGGGSEFKNRSTTIASDRISTKSTSWVFSLTTIPILIIIVFLVVSCIAIYVHRYRIIRFYIAWKREEPKSDFKFDLFICLPEEFDSDLISDVKVEIVDKANNVALNVFWSEHEECNLTGLNHYVNAIEILKNCRKFIFVVDEKFCHCYFCKQMVELATDRSSNKNLNIILPIKWTANAIVPVELMRYRYIERENGSDYFHEIENFLEGRLEKKRYRARGDYQMVELNSFAFREEDTL